jgi:hypothetical protein
MFGEGWSWDRRTTSEAFCPPDFLILAAADEAHQNLLMEVCVSLYVGGKLGRISRAAGVTRLLSHPVEAYPTTLMSQTYYV